MSRWLSEVEKSYYKRVESFLASESGGEDKLFLNNVIQQILSDGARRVCSDKDGSRIMQGIMESSHVDATSLHMLLKALGGEYRDLATDRCGSHVIESLIRAAARVLSARESGTLQAQFLTLCTVLTTHLSELIAHPYGGHVISGLIQVLAGIYVSDNFSRSRYSQEFRKAKMASAASSATAVLPWKQKGGIQIEQKMAVPDSFSKHLESVGKAICKLHNLSALLCHKCASPVLQVALKALTERLPARGRKLARKIVRCPGVLGLESEGTLPSLFTDAVGSHLMEAVIAGGSPSLLQHMFDTCFRERVVAFALHPVANYTLQQLVAMATPTQVSVLVEGLTPHLEEILFVGHTGVVVCLAQAVCLCPQEQPSFLSALLSTFHTEDTPLCCGPLLLSLTTHEVYYASGKEEESAVSQKAITVHGSLMVQSLLLFQDPSVVVRSLLRMVAEGEHLVRLSCDPSGSRVLEALMASRSVPTRSKDRLAKRITGRLLPLCTDRSGSRVVDAVWRHCEVKRKKTIAQKLLAHEEKLASNFYGRIVLRNCNVVHYKKKQTSWRGDQSAVAHRRDLFQDIVSTDEITAVGKSDDTPRKRGGGEGKRGGGERKKNTGRKAAKRKIPLFESDSESPPNKRTKL